MKARFCPVVLSLACGLLTGIAARAADAGPPPHSFVNPDDPRVAAVRRAGERVIDHAGTALVLEVRRTLGDTAPAAAVARLHLRDYKPPAALSGQPAVTTLRRTSLRLRNPANAPDEADVAAMELIEQQLRDGEPVAGVIVQRVTRPGQTPEWRVYRPLAVLKQCLACHGTASTLAPGVAEELKLLYPVDRAVDYQAGAWRGIIRASLPDSAPP